jgi:acyl-CoA thioesterase FadM
MKFRKAARLGDLVEVVTSVKMSSAYRARFMQRVERQGVLLVDAEVDIVCLGGDQQLREFPSLGNDGAGTP